MFNYKQLLNTVMNKWVIIILIIIGIVYYSWFTITESFQVGGASLLTNLAPGVYRIKSKKNNKFCKANVNGTLYCDETEPGDKQKLRITPVIGKLGEYTIESLFKNKLCGIYGDDLNFKCDPTAKPDTFKLYKVEGTTIVIQSLSTGKWCTVENSNILRCNRPKPANWEYFELIFIGEEAQIENGIYKIMGGRENKKCEVDNSKIIKCSTNSSYENTDKNFEIKHASNGKGYTIKNLNTDKYCQDRGNNGIICDSASIDKPSLIFYIFKSGDKYTIRGANNTKWCSDTPSGMYCNVNMVDKWETYTIAKVDISSSGNSSSGNISSGNILFGNILSDISSPGNNIEMQEKLDWFKEELQRCRAKFEPDN